MQQQNLILHVFLTNGENEINITNHGRLLCTKIKLCA